MLVLKDIKKTYKTKDYEQDALKKVSIQFRKQEFVSILGESGSGKTTMLNIIGGLDKYDSGDLVIEGVSTKKYKDSDWDGYRNNRVGFVFQSFNLIPHQTILSNVELALTLSGISPKERRERATEALRDVGLIDHIHKKPNQLSGGQVQRVAIARALIKDPEIILADEPTGALDSDTSLQIMNLLKKVGEERLVIMVTHNSKLAHEYSDRIVELKDGELIEDSNPYDNGAGDDATLSTRPKKSRMSFLTAISLSISNLLTKKGRTIITSLAGSIGIIGIAAILALASGINLYIEDIERDTMSAYPISIDSSGIDITSFLEGGLGGSSSSSGEKKPLEKDEINVIDTFTSLFSQQTKNDLTSFKKHIEANKAEIDPYVKNIQYKYGITPEIFLKDEEANLRQVNPDTIFADSAFGGPMPFDMISGAGNFGMRNFSQLPGDSSLFIDQYDLVLGDWPKDKSELLIVLSESGSLTDRTMYTLGIWDRKNLKTLFERFASNEEVKFEKEDKRAVYSELLDINFKLIDSAQKYVYDESYNIWVDKSDDVKFMDDLIERGLDLNIVGIIKVKEEIKTPMLNSGIYYTTDLISYLITQAETYDIVKNQIENQDINVFTSRGFGQEEMLGPSELFKLEDFISVDQGMIAKAFNFNASKVKFDLKDFDINIDINNIDLPDLQLDVLAGEIGKQISVPSEEVQAIFGTIIRDFIKIEEEKGVTNIDEWMEDFDQYIQSEEVRNKLMEEFSKLGDNGQISEKLSEIVQNYFSTYVGASFNKIIQDMQGDILKQIESKMPQIASNLQKGISINTKMLTQAFQFKLGEDELFDLITSLGERNQANHNSNLTKLGFRDLDDPTQIDIYPKDFTTKENVVNFIEKYNDQMTASNQEEKVVKYSDLISALLSSVTTIIDTITYALVAFVAISLVVSSIMIGVITYVSVLERIKEIGILRAIGASKKDIRRVFNAETLIIGFGAGVFGIIITYGISYFANIIVYDKFNIPNIAHLELKAAGILVFISMLLAFTSGLIPSSSAANKDPVEALRSE